MAKSSAKKPADLPEPAFQPGTYDPKGASFSGSPIWWWNNGIWGDAGYAIPNDGGKPSSGNETVVGIHSFIGAELFGLMHEPDVYMSRPFNAFWLKDLNRLLELGIKRLGDAAVGWTDRRQGDSPHATNTTQSFIVYPVPYFGGRVRQQDAKRWCGWVLQGLGELMQHSDNAYNDDITDFGASYAQGFLNRVRKDMAMKYLGATREQVEDPAYVVPENAFDAGVYDPAKLRTRRELTQERGPQQWRPQTNDLTPINGIPMHVAKQWAQRWPDVPGSAGDGGAHETAFPGSGGGIVANPAD